MTSRWGIAILVLIGAAAVLAVAIVLIAVMWHKRMIGWRRKPEIAEDIEKALEF